MPVAASADGSLRLSWNGLLDDDRYAPAGSYTWSLQVAAGDQQLRTVDGLRDVTGKLTVTRTKVALPLTAPTIEGTPRVGETLTVHVDGVPAGATLAYQWYRGTKSLGKSATAQQYQVASADAGKTLKVKVTVSGMEAFKDTSATSRSTAKVAKGVLTEGTLTLQGSDTPSVDSVLTVVAEGWDPQATIAYQWYRVNAKGKSTTIAKRTDHYSATTADVGYSLKVVAVVSRPGFTTRTPAPLFTAVTVGAGSWSELPTMTIAGSATVGATLQAATSGDYRSADGQAVQPTLSYQWVQIDGDMTTLIKGATKPTYKPVAGDLGYRLSVRLMVGRAGYPPASVHADPGTGTVTLG